MIKAEKDLKEKCIKVLYEGDLKEKESELIAVLISALDDFSKEDLQQMLQTAAEYKDNGKSGYFIFSE